MITVEEVHLRKLLGKTIKHFKEQNWLKLQEIGGEVSAMIDYFHQLRDTRHHAWCTQFQMFSHYVRRDITQLLRML